MAGKPVHVVPKGEGWAVKSAGATKASRCTETQAEAIQIGRAQAKNNQTELVIHRQDGTIRDSDSYGKDPCPPKDMKH